MLVLIFEVFVLTKPVRRFTMTSRYVMCLFEANLQLMLNKEP